MIYYNKKIFNDCFDYRGRHWWRNFACIPTYCHRMNFLLKHGYDETALWDTWAWFIPVFRDILNFYMSDKTTGVPTIISNTAMTEYYTDPNSFQEWENNNTKAWNDILSRLSELLNIMDVGNSFDNEEAEEAAKEFFNLFGRYFYDFWD